MTRNTAASAAKTRRERSRYRATALIRAARLQRPKPHADDQIGEYGDDAHAHQGLPVWPPTPGRLVTHRFALDDILNVYDTFGNASKHAALKVVLKVH